MQTKNERRQSAIERKKDNVVSLKERLKSNPENKGSIRSKISAHERDIQNTERNIRENRG